MDNIADPKTRTLMGTLTKLPTPYAVPILMRATLNMTVQEIADYHKVSKAAIQRRIIKGINIIKLALIE